MSILGIKKIENGLKYLWRSLFCYKMRQFSDKLNTDSFFFSEKMLLLMFKSRNAIKVFFSKFKYWIVSSLNHLANIERILPILNSSQKKSCNGRLRDNQVYCNVKFQQLDILG